MGVKNALRLTEIGIIPSDWNLSRINDLVDSKRTIRYGIVQPGKYDYNGRFMVRGQDYSFGWADPDTLFRVSNEVEDRYKNARLKKGDLILTIVGAGTGHIEMVPGWLDGANITQTTARIPLDEQKIDPRFCKYFFQSETGKRQISLFVKGAAQPGLNIADVRIFLVPLPSYKEQSAIATALSDTDALISSLEKLIAKKRAIKQGAMQELLTGTKRLEGFEREKGYKKSEMGYIPNDWNVKEFSEVMDGFTSGQTPSRAVGEYFKGNIPWITSGELNYNIITDTIEKISIQGVQNANLKIIPKGTFLFAITGLEAAGTRGSCAITGIEATTNQSCMALYPKKGLLTTPYLYYYYLRYGNDLALKYCQGTKQQSYTGGVAKKLPIIVPPTIEEQTAIASVLKDMDSEITTLESKLSKYRQIKSGMMQSLLTGKIRLV
jgi:type I restriction enzyme, S subunit